MKVPPQHKSRRVLPGLDVRLRDELSRTERHARTAPAPGMTDLPSDSATALYRYAIERLEAQVAHNDGHPPMRKEEVDMMCRCLVTCRTLEEAIRCAAAFCQMLHPRAGALRLSVQDCESVFEMDSLRRTRSTGASLVDVTGLLCYLQLFSWLIAQPLRLTRVWLAHPKRSDVMPLLGLFNAPVTVDASTYGFAFETALLARPVVRQPVELEGFLAQFPYQIVDAAPTVVTWAQKARGILDGALERGHALPSLQDLAQWFGISEPTLRRRLAAEGVSYLTLRERSLREAAERCLRDTDWPVSRIASHLGFGGEEAFRRAFVRWTGRAPSHYRSQMRVQT